jgi:hypothetical protein
MKYNKADSTDLRLIFGASLFLPRESLVVTSRLGTGNSRTFFLRCTGQKSAKFAKGRKSGKYVNASRSNRGLEFSTFAY